MKFSYFNKGNNIFAITQLTRGLTYLLSSIAPRFSTFLGKNILLRPYGNRTDNKKLIAPEKELNLLTSMGIAHINLFGKGDKVIIVSHGWADNSQSFHQIISSLVAQGFLVAAVDHIGHGKSTGKKSHLLGFIETLELLIDFFHEEAVEVSAIIAHSMGAIATLNLPFYLLKDKKIIMISSPIKFFELMFNKVEQAGISSKLLERVLVDISAKQGKRWQQLTPENNREKLALDITFIHDRHDRYAPFSDIESFIKGKENLLIATEGLGHRKILGDTKVIQNITKVLAA